MVLTDEHGHEEEEEAEPQQRRILRPTSRRLPSDIPALVGLLHRAMPRELVDPGNGHAVDTTYLDTDVRIIRYTGPRYEGVRDIFVRVPISSDGVASKNAKEGEEKDSSPPTEPV
jgi:hypothetical protein